MLGLFWVSLGLTANEWTVPILFGIDHLGPLSLIFIRGFSFAAICWGLITIYWFSDDIVQNVNLLCCATILTLSFTEGMLHLFPTILGREFANGILTKYSTRPDGIYYYDPLLRMNFMKPNFRTKMYYNGYTWVHQTDKFGFRNFQTVTNADVVLLGDSFIYGHGVDVKQTVGFFIEEISGYSVFNLAREGDCSLQEAYLLTWYLRQFSSPRYVLYFFYENDINDLYTYRTDKELIAIINTPLADKNLQLGLRLRKPRKADHGEDHLWARFALFKAIKQSALFNAIKQRFTC